MIKLSFIQGRTQWKGECPRCGVASFYAPVWSHSFMDGSLWDVVECPEGHAFAIQTSAGSGRKEVEDVYPISGAISSPTWLPSEYGDVYSEMMFDFKSKKYRSAISMASIILESHVNALLRNPGEKKKPLAQRLEVLIKHDKIGPDQFSDATIVRLGRNEVLHPEELNIPVTEVDALETIEAVMSCLERFYKWRSSRALPAPEEQIEEVVK